MPLILLVIAIAAGLYFGMSYIMETGSDPQSLSERAEEKLASPSSPAATPSTPSSPTASPTSSPTVAPSRVIILDRNIPAFDTANASKQIGQFLKGSTLTVESTDPFTGKTLVKYPQPDGSSISALCNPADLKPLPIVPATASAPKPASVESTYGQSYFDKQKAAAQKQTKQAEREKKRKK
jgi:hypothetical protein